MKRICLIGPYPPPYGGMAVQLKLLGENLLKEGFNVSIVKANIKIPKFLNFKGVRTCTNFFFYFSNLLRTIPKNDIIYIFGASHLYFFLIVTPAVLLGNLFCKRVFVNYRGGGPQDFFRRNKYLIKSVLKKSKIVVPSAYLQEVIKQFLDLDSYIVPNFTYLEQFTFRKRSLFQPLLLCTRNFYHFYNIPCIIKAFKLISERYHDAFLGLVGDGPEKENIINLIHNLGIEKKIKLYGKISHDKLPSIYNRYDIFVNASRIDNFPGSILEAFSAGLPVVTSNVGGIPYLVKNGETGFLVDPDNYEEFAEKIIFLIRNPEVTKTLVNNARKVAETYKWENIKKILINLWEAA